MSRYISHNSNINNNGWQTHQQSSVSHSTKPCLTNGMHIVKTRVITRWLGLLGWGASASKSLSKCPTYSLNASRTGCGTVSAFLWGGEPVPLCRRWCTQILLSVLFKPLLKLNFPCFFCKFRLQPSSFDLNISHVWAAHSLTAVLSSGSSTRIIVVCFADVLHVLLN